MSFKTKADSVAVDAVEQFIFNIQKQQSNLSGALATLLTSLFQVTCPLLKLQTRSLAGVTGC